ncbi:uncharacterized protein RHO17_024088 isoform 2-T2 [Thomomys bottae]
MKSNIMHMGECLHEETNGQEMRTVLSDYLTTLGEGDSSCRLQSEILLYGKKVHQNILRRWKSMPCSCIGQHTDEKRGLVVGVGGMKPWRVLYQLIHSNIEGTKPMTCWDQLLSEGCATHIQKKTWDCCF